MPSPASRLLQWICGDSGICGSGVNPAFVAYRAQLVGAGLPAMVVKDYAAVLDARGGLGSIVGTPPGASPLPQGICGDSGICDLPRSAGGYAMHLTRPQTQIVANCMTAFIE